ncbi:MarR family transcriptional regulator [Mesorhizobium sp.]|uniref:MarR family winged helix-turn-helix transcriptional regulator n=1 Tax=Mesorhizobium sp. TaxID=1871066 RepID=UPI000FE33D7E|nr:MarR family transcriptional regulator [Mesorhizobium sp.]RWG85374.1 MAG: MarR family transcriptional regulator [Mesorhizobium sp.]RWG86230.1 MAG: MarR family transcriptional regulator [Mesorhizobium sp.]RWK13278.1 MAG: MarR family transcriptional regulator [Mesorhizobium sp.]RWK16938.1 MAG: MarR family transcriptional regulator [Mesorhizobium sp.]TIQ50881.1 MAG: MarR family transcriptional regulator [Mesorhizobium sp.]
MEKIEIREKSAAGSGALNTLVGYNLRRASVVMLNDFEVEFAEVPLRPTTFAMLATVDENPGISSAELCRLLGIKSANMAPLIAEQEKRGLIERRAHAEDKRVQILFLTAEARKAMPKWRQQALRHEKRVLLDLTKKERATLLRLLRRVWSGEEG